MAVTERLRTWGGGGRQKKTKKEIAVCSHCYDLCRFAQCWKQIHDWSTVWIGRWRYINILRMHVRTCLPGGSSSNEPCFSQRPFSELRSCVKVVVDVRLGSRPYDKHYGFCARKATLNQPSSLSSGCKHKGSKHIKNLSRVKKKRKEKKGVFKMILTQRAESVLG